MRSFHDMGGQPAGRIERHEHGYAQWEKRVDAILMLLLRCDPGLMTVDELRRNVEGLGAEAYGTLGYYERWISAITQTMIQRGVIHIDQLGRKMAEIEERDLQGER